MNRKGRLLCAAVMAAQLAFHAGALARPVERAAETYESGRLGAALLALELGDAHASGRLLLADNLPGEAPAPEITPEPTAEPSPEPASEPAPEPTPESTPEPTPESTPEPTPEATEEPTSEPTSEPTPEPTPKATPEPTSEPTPEIVPFTDDTGMEIRNKTDLEADIAALMAEPLTQRLSAAGPQILIIHTHGTEAYLPAAGEEYTPSDPYRTTDPERSVIRVGDALCSALEEYGLRVLHDRTLYDYPSYAGSYERAAASIEAYLAEYPDIALVLDVHRDAIGDASTVYKTCAAANGTAQVMLVCGTDEYLEHPLWRENLKLALAMQAAAISANGALMRPIHLAPERYNQQYTTGSLIIEVGTNGNTLSEALAAAELFGRAAGEMLASLAAAD